MTVTERTQIQGSTMNEMIDRLAAINATADHNGGLKQDDLREHHNITEEIRRRKLRTQLEAIRAGNATIGDDIRNDFPRPTSADLAYGSRWNEYQQ